MILIADSGSTKTEWCVADQGRPIRQITTAGMNLYFQTAAEMGAEIQTSLRPAIAPYPIEAVYFYGAGCAFPEQKRQIEEVIRSYLGTAAQPETSLPVEAYSDLTGAARALCGKQPGIACILGTGSNSCLYDGKEIIRHTPPLGYILGDEGSGAVLGKQLVSDCLKHQLPEALCRKFLQQYELTPEILLERVYKQPFPNRFLASLSPFLAENLAEEPLYAIVYNSFRSFLIRNVMTYEGYETRPVHCTGSIAYHYQEVLKAAAASLHLTMGKIEKAPIPGLVSYHASK